MAFTPDGDIRYELKTPYRDGTTHVIFEPLDFMARLAAINQNPYNYGDCISLIKYEDISKFIAFYPGWLTRKTFIDSKVIRILHN